MSKVRSHWPISTLSGVAALINMLLPLVLVRLLAPEAIGTFKIFFLYLGILPAFSLTMGVINGLSFWAGREEAKKAIQTSSSAIFLSAILFFLITWLFQGTITAFIGWEAEFTKLFLIALAITIASNFFEEAAIATGRIWVGPIFYASFEVLRTAVIVVAVYYYRSLEALFIAHIAVSAVKLVLGYSLGLALELVGFTLNWDSFKSVYRYALPVSIASCLGVFVIKADQVILSTFISAEAFAYYTIGCLSLAPLFILEQSVTRVLIPDLSRAFARGENLRAARVYAHAVRQLGMLLIPAVVGLIVFAKPIIELLFTAQYSSAASYLEIFALSYLLLIIPYDSVPRAKGYGTWILKNYFLFAIVSLGLSYTFAQSYGTFGALAGIIGSGLSMRIYGLSFAKRDTGWKLHQFIPVRSLAWFALLSLLLGYGSLVLKSSFSSELEWFLICGGAFAIIYLSIIYLTRVQPVVSLPSHTGVMMLTQQLVIGGLEKTVLDLCLELKHERKLTPFVFAYDYLARADKTDLVPQFEKNNIAIETFKKPRGFSFKVVRKIIELLKKHELHIIHSHNLGSLMYASIAKLCLGWQTFPLKIVHTQHSFVHLTDKRRYALYEKIFSIFADEIVAVSNDTRETYLSLGVNPDKVKVIENGVRFSEEPVFNRKNKLLRRQALIENILDEETRSRLKQYSDEPWIIYLARLHPGKGQDHALQLWNALSPQARKQSIMMLIGPEAEQGEKARIEALIEKASDRNRIFLLEGTTRPQAWIQASDIYLSCSEFEGLPLGPLEAIGIGVPTILSKIPGHEFLAHVSSQYSIESPREGALKLEQVLSDLVNTDPYWEHEYKHRSRWIRQRFSVEAMVQKYFKLYSLREV